MASQEKKVLNGRFILYVYIIMHDRRFTTKTLKHLSATVMGDNSIFLNVIQISYSVIGIKNVVRCLVVQI